MSIQYLSVSKMQAWVARRREAGSLLHEAIQIGDTPAPFELLVVEVTDQGQRRPTKVARLVPVGTRAAVAELIAPKLIWFRKWGFVLSGTEEAPGLYGKQGLAQSWLCKLSPPPYAVGFLARNTHKEGVELARREQLDRYAASSKGCLSVSSALDPVLGRHTVRAELESSGAPRRDSTAVLIDVELAWMSKERFSLSGFYELATYEGRPAQLMRQGWLCEYEIEEPEEDARPLRNTKPQR